VEQGFSLFYSKVYKIKNGDNVDNLELAQNKLNALERALILETRVSEKFSLEQEIVDLKKEMQNLSIFKNSNPEVLDFKQHLKKLRQAAAEKDDELEDVFDEIQGYFKHLKSKGTFDDEEHFQTLESFLLDKSDALDLEDFIAFCQQNLNPNNISTPKTQLIDYQSFSKRLQNGEVTLFLGMQTDEYDLTQQFTQMDCTNGLAETCEKMELKGGRKNLIKELCHYFKIENTKYLYELLSSIEESLLIISAHYDDSLEQNFRKNHKKYVKVLQHWQREGFSITQAKSLILEYSDKDKVEICTSEELAGKKLLESGYSLIYKLRGCLKSQHYQESGEETFILSEYEHLDFSRLIKIPEYVISKLRRNYLWFLGHHLQSWEERMLIRVVLNRVSAKSPMAIQNNASDYLQKYWHDINNVTVYPVVLTDFVKNLREHLS
jgi:hypothetical protein